MKLPQARTKNLVEQNLVNETLIYDLVTDKAFNLNETSTAVYQACNGQTTFDELKRAHKFTDDLIYLALDELKRNDLLADGNAYQSPFAKTSRREIIKKIGLTSVIALPLIVGMIAPKAVGAQSVEELTCREGSCTCSVLRTEGEEFPAICSAIGGTSDCGVTPGCDCLVLPDNSGFCGEFLD